MKSLFKTGRTEASMSKYLCLGMNDFWHLCFVSALVPGSWVRKILFTSYFLRTSLSMNTLCNSHCNALSGSLEKLRTHGAQTSDGHWPESHRVVSLRSKYRRGEPMVESMRWNPIVQTAHAHNPPSSHNLSTVGVFCASTILLVTNDESSWISWHGLLYE